MTLYINTTDHDLMIIALYSGFNISKSKLIISKKIKAPGHQAEKLIPAVSKLLESQKIKPQNLKKIIVAHQGPSFTALRIGVITANALAYALNIPVEAEKKTGYKNKKFSKYSLVEPQYDRQIQIGSSKKFKF